MEYLATVVEFDAWDKLDKDWTSNVALRNMTPDNVSDVSTGYLSALGLAQGMSSYHVTAFPPAFFSASMVLLSTSVPRRLWVFGFPFKWRLHTEA